MRGFQTAIVLAACVALASPVLARTAIESIVESDASAGGSPVLAQAPGHLECVPYARTTSGIRIFGDAHTWWSQAAGRYATGRKPRIGAVMAMSPYANSRLGHVATVSRIVDARTILLSHANWSMPGQVERNVTALDVSPRNDWSQVRIWYAPIHNLGTTRWPVVGFIYNAKPGSTQDLGSDRLAEAAVPARMTKAARTVQAAPAKGRHRDPIGAIIAGIY